MRIDIDSRGTVDMYIYIRKRISGACGNRCIQIFVWRHLEPSEWRVRDTPDDSGFNISHSRSFIDRCHIRCVYCCIYSMLLQSETQTRVFTACKSSCRDTVSNLRLFRNQGIIALGDGGIRSFERTGIVYRIYNIRYNDTSHNCQSYGFRS